MNSSACIRRRTRAGWPRMGWVAIAIAGLSTAAHAENTFWRLIDSCQNQDFSAQSCWSATQFGPPTPAPRPGDSTTVVIQAVGDPTLQTQPLTTVNLANQADPLFRIASLGVSGYSLDSNPGQALANAVLNVARGTLYVTGETVVGAMGTGTINQSGGLFLTTSLRLGPGENSTYAGLSSFNLSGGSFGVAGDLQLGGQFADGQFRQSGGFLNVGSVSGPGTFTFDGGTLVLGRSISVGSFVMAHVSLQAPASFTLSGSQRSLQADTLTVGETFEGVLKVADQAQMSTGSAALGSSRTTVGFFTFTGNGRIEVTGSGSSWTNTQDVILGGTANASVGTGTLTVSSQGLVSVGGQLQLWSKGTLQVSSGGHLDAANLVMNGGLVQVQDATATVGALRMLAGSQLQVGDAPSTQLLVNGPADIQSGAQIENNQFIVFNGKVSLSSGASFSGYGAKVYTGGLALTGSQPTVVFDSGWASFAPTNVFEVELGNGVWDELSVAGPLFLNGTLKLLPWNGYQGRAGDSFAVLAGIAMVGAFNGVDTSAFQLAPGLEWDFSRLNSNGVIAIVAAPVPEPAQWLLMLGGLAGLRASKRRRQA